MDYYKTNPNILEYFKEHTDKTICGGVFKELLEKTKYVRENLDYCDEQGNFIIYDYNLHSKDWPPRIKIPDCGGKYLRICNCIASIDEILG